MPVFQSNIDRDGKTITRKALAQMKRADKAFQKQQQNAQWFETFRAVFIACGDLDPNGSYTRQLHERERRCKRIASHIESLRPVEAGYTSVPALYAGK